MTTPQQPSATIAGKMRLWGPRITGAGGILFILVPLEGVTKGWRARVQALLLALPQFLHYHVLHALLLVSAGDGAVWINLSSCRRFHRYGHLVEAFQQRIPLEVIIQQHAPQVGMAGKLDAEEIICLALQPVCSRPDRNNAVHLRLLVIQAYLDL